MIVNLEDKLQDVFYYRFTKELCFRVKETEFLTIACSQVIL